MKGQPCSGTSGSKLRGKMFFSKNLNNNWENMLTSADNEW